MIYCTNQSTSVFPKIRITGRVILSMALFCCMVSCHTNKAKTPVNNTWQYDGLGTWQTSNDTLSLVQTQNPTFDIRRPAAIALIDDKNYENFELSASIKCGAAADNVHGDVLLIFGYQSPNQFYYTHLSGLVDDVHTGIFVVNNADRKRIDLFADKPILTDREWHNVQLKRNATSGLIEVFIDDNNLAHLSTTDNTFKSGKVGVGSFDDTASFTNVKISSLD